MLILDQFAVKAVSSAVTMSDIMDLGVSLVEDLRKKREPLPKLEAIYFVAPTLDNAKMICQDFEGKTQLYKAAHIFFTSMPSATVMQKIKSCKKLVSSLRNLQDANLEFEVVDSRTFVTENEEALGLLYGEGTEEGSPSTDREIKAIARRLATLCLSLGEFPYIRFRSPQGSGLAGLRAHVPGRIASAVHEILSNMSGKVDQLAEQGSSDLIVLDRGIDPVAAVIHEWTYEAMCHDLLDMKSNVYTYEVETNSGKMEHKEVILSESDPLWLELRHLHIGDASLRLNQKMAQFSGTNKAAKARRNGSDGPINTNDLKGLVQSLPEYRDQLSRLALHIDIATALNARVRKYRLDEIGTLEQEVVHGDATSKDIMSLIQNMPAISSSDKLRLLMCYVSTHQERLDNARRQLWSSAMQVSAEEMVCLQNLECLGIAVSKRETSDRMKFSLRKPKKGVRREKVGADNESSWQLSRFVPILSDVIEEVDKGALSSEDYPYVQAPSTSRAGARSQDQKPSSLSGVSSARSVRSTWTKRTISSGDNNSSLGVSHEGIGRTPGKRRLIVFIVGGATYSETRLVHKLSQYLGREIILGSTSMVNPSSFLQHVHSLTEMEDVSLSF